MIHTREIPEHPVIRAMETGGEYPARRNWVIARNVGDDDYIVPRADVVIRPYKNGSFDSPTARSG